MASSVVAQAASNRVRGSSAAGAGEGAQSTRGGVDAGYKDFENSRSRTRNFYHGRGGLRTPKTQPYFYQGRERTTGKPQPNSLSGNRIRPAVNYNSEGPTRRVTT